MGQDLEARVKELESKVQKLTDLEEIRVLRHRYHDWVNTGRWSDLPDLFSEDGEVDFGYLGHAKGRTEMAALLQRAPELLPFVKQFIHNHVIELQGDAGTGSSYLEAKSVSNGESYLVAARYDDEYVRQGGRWKFRKMVLTPYFTVPLREGWAQEDRLKMGRQNG
jgi:hypothetical protein